eukprot:2942327-Pyramimonas_sp.AAC.1
MGQLALEGLGGATPSSPTSKAKGVDQLGPPEIEGAPKEARHGEQAVTWPRQVAASKCALAAEPQGGDRALGMMAPP